MKPTVIAGAIVVALAGCAQMSSSGGAGWVTLIDGTQGLENFIRVGDANWRAEDGAIVADKGKGGFLMTKNSYKDVEIRVEFWAAHDANSGIYFRCADPSKLTDKSCYEANIFDQRPDQTYSTGGIVHRAPVPSPAPKAGGKWNTYLITAKGSQLTVVLNGQQTANIQNTELSQGPIALQYGSLPPNAAQGGAIKFRKVQIRPL